MVATGADRVQVVDASAVIAVLVGRPPAVGLHEQLAEDPDLHAPHLVDVEVLHALRRLERLKALSRDRANDARTDYRDLTICRCSHEPLADRAWELRANLTAYDAMYVALAELLEAPLVTCDGRLAMTARRHVSVRLFAS